jgi:flagellar motor switch protein FliN
MSNEGAQSSTAPDQFVQKWAEALAQVLGEISGAPIPAAVLSEPLTDVPGAGETDLWMVALCAGAVRGEMSLRIPGASAGRLAQIFMSQPATPDAALSPEHREGVLELVRQANGLFATSLRAACGEVQIGADPTEAAPSWPASSTWWLRFGEGTAASFVEFRLSAALTASLRTETTEAPAPADAAAGPLPLAPEPEPALHDQSVNLHALMDVELAVSLRFGGRRLLLREILDLNPGAVIELDRHVQEPVDLLLDGRVVARGEIVVLDGNYGLRVTAVAPASR